MFERKPSKFCPDFCEFVKHNDFCCRKYTECWHLKDRNVSPRDVEVTINGISHRVTIIGENDVFAPIWYLKEGSLPQMLPKNYEIFSAPITRKGKSKKEIYDSQKKENRKNRDKAHK